MMLVKVQQGTADWHAARAGVITASMFKIAREKLSKGANAGQPTEKAKNYAFRLAIERIAGEALEGQDFETWQMKRGRDLEPKARERHAFLIDAVIDDGGFAISKCGRFGASADGLIETDGGAEYKCLIAPESLREVYLTGDVSEYIDQVQGGMFVTGRKWWDFCVYCPPLSVCGRDLFRRRIERDQPFIDALEKDMNEFDKLIEQYKAKLEAE